MMRTLLLMRHAKSSWAERRLADHDRPLNARGQRDAPRMGALLARERTLPALILSSTAVRTRETVALLVDGIGGSIETRFLDDLYLASARDCLAIVGREGGGADPILVVAHNPGLEDLVSHLAGRPERMPTATIARFDLALDDWRELTTETAATLAWLWRPKQLL